MSRNNIINWNIEKSVEPITKVEPYEYLKVIKYLKDYFSDYKYYNNLYDQIKDQKLNGPLEYSELNDKIIREYIKCRPGIGIIVLFPKSVEKEDQQKEFFKLLEKNGKIYYTKTIEVTYRMMYNIIYQQYANTYRMKNNQSIIYKVNRLGMKSFLPDIKKIRIVVFEPNPDVKIFGSSVDFKTNLRNLFLEPDLKTTKIDPASDAYPRAHDYLHINDTFNEAVEYADLFFNDHSLSFLKRQACWRYISFIESQFELFTLKKKLFDLPIVEQYKLIITSSAILSIYGVRELNDIDLIAMDDLNIDKKKLYDILKLYDVSYRHAADISKEFLEDWTEYWENELNERIKLFTNAPNYNEFVLDPNNCFYFCGLKFLRLKYEIPIRALRKGRPAQTADLLVMRRLLNLNYIVEIPKMNRVWNKETEEKEDVPVTDIKTYIKTVQYYLKDRYNLVVNIDNVKLWLEMTKVGIKEDTYLGGSKMEDLYSEIKNISENKIVYPNEEQLFSMGYNIFTRYLSDNRPYIVEGEEWTHNNQRFCLREGENNIRSKNNSILRVCSFNVHNFVSRCNQDDDPLFGDNINIFETPRNIDKFIKMFKEVNADVLCLQEVIPLVDKSIKDDILDIRELQKINFEFLNKKMEEIGYRYRVIYDTNAGNFTKNESTDYVFNSNAIYSKYPISNQKGYQLFVNANICFVDIKVKGKLITIGNTQLNSNIQNGKIDESNKIAKGENILLMQNKVIKHIVEQITSNNLILCGDFNLNIYQKYEKVYNKQLEPNEKIYNEIREPIIELFNNTMNNSYTTNFTNGLQTDFILMRKNTKNPTIKPLSTFIYNTIISDHNAVIANFLI